MDLPGDQIAQGVVHCGPGPGQAVHCRGGFGRGALLDQLLQWVNGLAGVQVEHQAVCIRGHGLKAEDLRRNGVFEVDDQAHHVGTELAHADAGNVRVRSLHLAHQLAQRGVQLYALDVHRQARWRGDEGLGALDGRVRFERDAAVIGGGPNAHRQHVGPASELCSAQAQHQKTRLDQATAVTSHGHLGSTLAATFGHALCLC